MASEKNLRSIFSDIAKAIRRKKGNTNKIIPINFSDEIDSIESGVFPQGKITLTDTSEYDVTQYATAQIVDEKLKPENIKIGENILGIEGNVTTLKGYLDLRKSAEKLFANQSSLTLNTLEKLIYYSDTISVTNMSYIFQDCDKLITIPELDTSSVTTIAYMFYNCRSLTSIPLLDTSNVWDMRGVFLNCSALQTIPQLNTIKVTNMQSMFYNCTSLITISGLDTISVTNMSYMFNGCILLNKIDITHMNISDVEKTSYFAINCFSLTKLIIRNMSSVPLLNSNAFNNCYHFTGQTNSTYNPDGLKDGRIYVPDDMVNTLKVATNWSTYADIIVPLSTLGE